MSAVTTEVEDASGQNVVADERNRISFGVSDKFTRPFAINPNHSHARMLETWFESWLFKVAVKCPTIRQRMHFLTAGTPVQIFSNPTPKSATYLTHLSLLG